MKHKFLFKKAVWLGEGKIVLSMAKEPLKIYMRWYIDPKEKNVVECKQEIQIMGISEMLHNTFEVKDLSKEKFQCVLENPDLGKVLGEGFVHEKVIGWEFKDPKKELQGFEFYQLQESGNYFMHAEYISGNTLKTEIQGKLWEQKDKK